SPRVLKSAPTSVASQHTLRRRNAGRLAAERRLQRAPDRLVGRLGRVVRVAARRLDVDRHAPRLRERAEEVLRQPGLGLERELGEWPAAEVDRGAREGVVHRYDGVAVARDAAAVAKRAVERLAEGERRVLDRVMVARLEIARAFDDQVEARVKGELLEEVVVDAGARLHRDAARAVEPEAHGDARLGGRAQVSDP